MINFITVSYQRFGVEISMPTKNIMQIKEWSQYSPAQNDTISV